MRFTILAALVAFLGCEAKSDEEKLLEGVWGLVNGSCVYGLLFQDGRFARSLICPLPDGSTGLEREEGSFDVVEQDSTHYIVFHATRSTCATKVFDGSAPFTVSQSTLSLTTASQVAVFQRLQPGGGSGVATFGCWDMGAFTERQLTAF
jgi:hypothetical protein